MKFLMLAGVALLALALATESAAASKSDDKPDVRVCSHIRYPLKDNDTKNDPKAVEEYREYRRKNQDKCKSCCKEEGLTFHYFVLGTSRQELGEFKACYCSNNLARRVLQI